MPQAQTATEELHLMIDEVSVKSMSHWLKQQNLKSSSKSKENFKELITEHIQSGALEYDDVKNILIQIREYASKTIYIYKNTCQFTDKQSFKNHIRTLGLTFSDVPVKAFELPERPTLNYITFDPVYNQYLAKFTETHTSIKYDKESGQEERTNRTNIIVISQNAKSGLIQTRLDKEGSIHDHKNDSGNSEFSVYLNYYVQKAEEIFNVQTMNQQSLRMFINRIVDADPRIFRISHIELTTPQHNKGTIKAQLRSSDVRDEEMYINASVGGNASYLKDSIHGYWIPAALNDSRLQRSIYMSASNTESKITFFADCLPEEINYVLSRIR